MRSFCPTNIINLGHDAACSIQILFDISSDCLYVLFVSQNIVTWNAGKTAKKGNQKDFLVTAGQLPATATATAVVAVSTTTETTASAGSTTSFRSVAIISRWFSPKKAASTAADTPASGTGMTITTCVIFVHGTIQQNVSKPYCVSRNSALVCWP